MRAAAAQLTANRRRGIHVERGLRYDFVCPSTAHYPFQWFWDSCFHAIALTHIDVALAEQELRCLLQGARPDGFIPHIIFWEREAGQAAIARYNLPSTDGWTTDTIQTPVLATAVRRVWEIGRSRAFLDDVLPATCHYYDWLATRRDPDRDGLINILQPDESGLDASPTYDAVIGLAEPTEAGLRQAMDRLFATYAPIRGNPQAMFATDAFKRRGRHGQYGLRRQPARPGGDPAGAGRFLCHPFHRAPSRRRPPSWRRVGMRNQARFGTWPERARRRRRS